MAHCFIWSENVDEIMEPLGMLKSNDTDFMNKIKVMNGNYDKNNDIQVKEKIVKANMDIMKYVDVKCMTLQERWQFMFNQVIDYYNSNKSLPENGDLYQWLRSQKKRIHKGEQNLYNRLSKYQFILDFINQKTRNTYEESKEELFNHYSKPNMAVPIYTTRLGKWYNDIKCKKINSVSDWYYIDLSTNKYVKENLDNYLLTKEKNKKNPRKTFQESLEIFFDECKITNEIPQKRKSKIGMWYADRKKNIIDENSFEYIELSKMDMVKKDLDIFLNKKRNK